MSEEWANIRKGLIEGRDIDLQSVIDQYGRWDDTNDHLIKEALAKHKIQYNEFATEERILNDLKSAAKTAKTRTQLMQTASMMSVEQLRQTRKLRALILSQIEMENYYRQIEHQERDMQRRMAKKFYEYKPMPVDGGGFNIFDIR